MNKMKLVSAYDHYGNPDMWDANSPVKCVCDEQIYKNKREGKQVMLLIEPRSIQPNVYDYAIQVANQYEYVFTHDSKLLKELPNAKPILWGNVWCRCEKPKKTKLISMTSSDKELCDLHKERIRIARKYKDVIDVYGTIDGGEYVDPFYTLNDYMYSVVIENYIDDIWFTEKLLNCFAMKVIPIYYGARDIGKYFNTKGIIICNSLEKLEQAINTLLFCGYVKDDLGEFKGAYYNKSVQEAIKENYELSKQYEKFDEWLYRTYEKEIGELFDGER